MKLGALKSAVKAAANVRIAFNLGNAHPVSLIVQKGSMLEQLDVAFPEGRSQETGFKLNEDGYLIRE